MLQYIIIFPNHDRAVVLVGETGFTSTANRNKATKFASAAEADAARTTLGIFNSKTVVYFKRPVLTRFEKFCWDNGDRSSAALATETNRTEQAVCAAYTRAHNKMRELAAIAKSESEVAK